MSSPRPVYSSVYASPRHPDDGNTLDGATTSQSHSDDDGNDSPSSPGLLLAGSPSAAAPDLPLTMTASTVLQHLPRDASAALAAAGTFARDKVVVRFKPVGSAPPLGPGAGGGSGGGSASEVRRKISSTQKFEVVVAFVRRALRVAETESVFLYVNSAFAPALDEVVGNLHQCFKDSNDQLNVSYSLTPAFG